MIASQWFFLRKKLSIKIPMVTSAKGKWLRKSHTLWARSHPAHVTWLTSLRSHYDVFYEILYSHNFHLCVMQRGEGRNMAITSYHARRERGREGEILIYYINIGRWKCRISQICQHRNDIETRETIEIAHNPKIIFQFVRKIVVPLKLINCAS